MANLRSSKKDIRRSEKRRLASQSAKSAIKTFVKKAKALATDSDTAKSTEAMRLAIKQIDKTCQRGIIHKNQAARRKSRLMTAINKAVQATKA